MNKHLSQLWSWTRRYLRGWTLVCLGVMAFVVFYGDHTVFSSIANDREVDSLRQVLRAKNDTTEYYRQLNLRLTTDPELMEQIVREQYRMKRAHEDVYVFIDDEEADALVANSDHTAENQDSDL